MNAALAFVSGLLFALGLGISGMTQPAKVIGFLDVFGSWDPSLAFVMMGAIAVHLPLQRLIRGRAAPVCGGTFQPLASDVIDARVIGGSAIFGVGWGLGGYCPGPAVTAVASGNVSTLLFVAAMLAGMALHGLVFRGSANAESYGAC